MARPPTYTVEIPRSAWYHLKEVPPGLEERVRAELERLALELATQPPAGGAAILTLPLPEGHSGLVFVDQQARRITLKEVTRAR